MGIRWRLAALGIQIAILLIATTIVVGRPYANETWFFAGLLAVVINPQLLEPYYPRPSDVVANSLIFVFLYLTSDPGITRPGWQISVIVILALGILALLGALGPKVTENSRSFAMARAARNISRLASAQRLYSVVFFLALLDFRPSIDTDFWILAGSWALLILVGNVNWQQLWETAGLGIPRCLVEGVIGPSVLTVSGPRLPSQDTWVKIASKSADATGVVIRRISRREDVWAQIHLKEPKLSEALLSDGYVEISELEGAPTAVVGSVDAGSSDLGLSFIATRPLETGQVVAVPETASNTFILYQITGATVEHTDVKGGAHLFERAKAAQLGIFDPASHSFRRHPWAPGPGAPVLSNLSGIQVSASPTPESWEVVGHVIGTPLPVYLDLTAASTGHVAILGMTKMGKSTLAERLARKLAETRRVTILDLTGEYVGKKGFPRCDKDIDWESPGVSVFEPKPNEIPAVRAEEFLKFLMDKAQPEYQAGEPFPRTVIIDEAHQFIPEPAGLGFNAPGRDNAFRIGLMMMQVRKFGISVILISQRTAVVAKSALSQCENLIAFRSVDQTGLDYLEALAGADVRPMLPRLQQGEALVFGPAISSELPVAVNVFIADVTDSKSTSREKK